MDNKEKILIGGLGVAVVILGYFLWKSSWKSTPNSIVVPPLASNSTSASAPSGTNQGVVSGGALPVPTTPGAGATEAATTVTPGAGAIAAVMNPPVQAVIPLPGQQSPDYVIWFNDLPSDVQAYIVTSALPPLYQAAGSPVIAAQNNPVVITSNAADANAVLISSNITPVQAWYNSLPDAQQKQIAANAALAAYQAAGSPPQSSNIISISSAPSVNTAVYAPVPVSTLESINQVNTNAAR